MKRRVRQDRLTVNASDYRMNALRLLMLCCALWSFHAAAQEAQRTAEAQRELGAVQKRIRALGEEITATRGKQDAVLGELNKLEQRIASTQAELRRLDEAHRAQQLKVDATRRQREQAVAALKAQQALLGQQMRAAFVMGDGAQTRMLMQQDDAQRVSRLMTYFERLNQARGAQIAAIDAQTRALRDLEARHLDEQQHLEQLSAEQQQVLGELEATRQNRGKVIAELEARIRDRGTALKQLQRDERDLQALLESLSNLLADIPLNLGNDKPFAQQRGRLQPPLKGRVLAGFGQKKGGTHLTWKGQWIGAPTGTAIRAVAPGRVAFVGWLNRYGLLVILEHEGNYYTLYGHQDTADVRLGEWVQGGAALGRAGTSGGHQQSGVYFEIRRGRNAVDPAGWLQR